MIDRTFFSVTLAIGFWSSCFVAIRTGLTGFDPEPVAFFRLCIAAVCMILFGIMKGIRLPRMRDVPLLFLHGIIGFALFNVAIFHGAKLISIGSTSFIVSTVPVIATVLAVVFLKEKITARAVIGLAISLSGVAIISFGEGDGLTLNIGALFVLGAAMSDSFYNVLQKTMLRRYTSVEYTTYTLAAGAISLSGYLPELLAQLPVAPPSAIGGILYLGIFGTAVPYAFWSYSISRNNVSRIVVSHYAVPILATLIGYLVLGETSPGIALWGGAIALVGAMVSSLPSRCFSRKNAQAIPASPGVSTRGFGEGREVAPCAIGHHGDETIR